MIYKKALGITFSKFEHDFVIVKRNEIFRVNEVAARIFDLCDGINTENEIIEKLSRYYNVLKADIEMDINKFIEELLSNKLIEIG